MVIKTKILFESDIQGEGVGFLFGLRPVCVFYMNDKQMLINEARPLRRKYMIAQDTSQLLYDVSLHEPRSLIFWEHPLSNTIYLRAASDCPTKYSEFLIVVSCACV